MAILRITPDNPRNFGMGLPHLRAWFPIHDEVPLPANVFNEAGCGLVRLHSFDQAHIDGRGGGGGNHVRCLITNA